ncbi:MAG: hypothetical protein K1X64_22860 [Myxococcaceae bacterium]|nr:hypothetical protein [Myxococcaceae bacterium]
MRFFIVLWVAFFAGCVQVEKTVRTERGPTLRTFEREKQLPGGVRAEFTLDGSLLTARLTAYAACQKETVEEFIEYRTTEQYVPGAGATLSAGISTTLAGGVLLGITPLLSPAPERSLRGGLEQTGPSTRQLATAWSIGTLVVGVPALVVGLVQYARSGESKETGKGERVLNLKETPCAERPAAGISLLRFSDGTAWPAPLDGSGQAQWRAQPTAGALEALELDGKEMTLDEEGLRALLAFEKLLTAPLKSQ